MTLGEAIRDLRTARGLSQGELASLATTTTTQISRLENGRRQLTEKWISRLAPHLNVSTKDVMAVAAEGLRSDRNPDMGNPISEQHQRGSRLVRLTLDEMVTPEKAARIFAILDETETPWPSRAGEIPVLKATAE